MRVNLQKSVSLLLEQLRANRHHLRFGFAPDIDMPKAADSDFWTGCTSAATATFQTDQIIKALELLRSSQEFSGRDPLTKLQDKLEHGEFSSAESLELINLLERLVSEQSDVEANNIERVALLREPLLNSGLEIQRVDILDIDAVGQITNAVKDKKVVEINLQSVEKKEDWNTILSYKFYEIAHSLEKELMGKDISFPIHEGLKNALVHGNKLNFNLPIFLHLNLDAHLNVREIEIYDMGETNDDLLVEVRKEKAVYENLYGSHEGKDKLGEHGWNPQLIPVVDVQSSSRIGTKCSFSRNT